MLALPPAKRRRLLGGIGRELKRQSIRNLRAQKSFDGTAWAPRKRGNDRKLLRRINRQVAANVVDQSGVEVSFKGAVAFQQSEGFMETMTAAKMQARERGLSAAQLQATKKQAKALRNEGFKIRVKGTKKWRKPTVTWITDNLSRKKAGLVLRYLRNETAKQTWVTKIPARPFLGATNQQINEFVNKVFDNTINHNP